MKIRLRGIMAIAAILVLFQPLTHAKDNTIPPLTYFWYKVYSSSLSHIIEPNINAQLSEEEGDKADGPGSVGLSSETSRVAVWTPSPISEPIENPPIEMFGVVEKGIVYRSGQPTEANYQWLLNHGFKSIVNLRRETSDTTDSILNLGFSNYLWLNIQDETSPSAEQSKRFLDFIIDSRNWPVLIHCKAGTGRTGTMVALIRYAVDGWPMTEAIKEARLYRNGVDLAQNQLDWLNRWAHEHPAGSHQSIALHSQPPKK
ncbi:MAG: tyrosine-protein phosphatase [Chloroflexi bacterium]|nr:tyrosine-protein phosphatase [Chloroflexota bacterium]